MNSTPEVEIEPWQVRIAYVEFPDKPGKGKARPILIYKVSDGIEAFKITTNANAPFPMVDLSQCNLGLKKPSWLQLIPLFDVDRKDIGPMIAIAPLELRKLICALLI